MPRTLEGIGQQVKDTLKHDIPIGAMSRAFRNLADPKELQVTMAFMDEMEHHEQLGKWGDKDAVIAKYGSDPVVATRAFDALQVDDLTASLIDRMGGPDSDRAPPPLTSRDYVEAALELHTNT